MMAVSNNGGRYRPRLPENLRFLNFTGDDKRQDAIPLRDDLLIEGVIAPGKADKLHADERAAIDAFMAKKGVRRFDSAETADLHNLYDYLKTKGHKAYKLPTVNWHHSQHRFSLDGRSVSRDEFIAFVDCLRAADGLPPIGRAAA